MEWGRRKSPPPTLSQAAHGELPSGGESDEASREASPRPWVQDRVGRGGAGSPKAPPLASRPPRGRYPRPALQVAAARGPRAGAGAGRGRSGGAFPRPRPAAAACDVTIAAGRGVPGAAWARGGEAARRRATRAPESWPSPGPSSPAPAPGPPAGASARRGSEGAGLPGWLGPRRLLRRARPCTCGGRRPARSAHGAWRRRRRPARAARSRRVPRGPPPSRASAYPWTKTTSSRAPCASSRSCGRTGSPSKFGPR